MSLREEIQTVLDKKLLSIPDALAIVQRYAPAKLDLYKFHSLPAAQKRIKLSKILLKLSTTQVRDLPVVQLAREIAPVKKPIAELLKEEFAKLSFNDLPDNLKLLVIRRYECKRLAVIAHDDAQNAETDDQRFDAIKSCVLLMRENWQIWAELDHYHKTNTILGQHESFKLNAFETKIQTIERECSALEAAKQLLGMMRTARNRIYALRKDPGQEKLIQKWIERYNLLAKKLNEKTWKENQNL